jgi:soluble lytic murein transglycosylase-like protein
MQRDANLNAWVVRKSGKLAAARYLVRGDLVRIGRSTENDIVLADEPRVSARHLEIRRTDGGYRLYDLQSTNGTYLNGKRVQQADLTPPASIRLGADGPELAFVVEPAAADSDETILSSTLTPQAANPGAGAGASILEEHERLLSSAVAKARLARGHGAFDQTASIMREMLGEALHKTSRKFRFVIAGLTFALAAVSGYGYWQISNLRSEKKSLDSQMASIEALLEQGNQDPAQAEQLIDRLDEFEGRAKALDSTLLYRIAARGREDLVTSEIRSLMAEFGAETYSIPPEFLDEVKRFLKQYQGPDRRNMERVMGEARPNVRSMQEILARYNLPPDLAYMVLVESGMSANGSSPAGAAGLWQLTPATARQYGLRVDGSVDDRLDIRKATDAASKYIRELILDFGAGSSVMLALAAYNVGPTRVKQAVHRLSDPIKQRNFWYLYRTRALPLETREYVPKVMAAMIVARHPDRFGF